MTLLLCPECYQWRDPVEGFCPVCRGTLDIAVSDPTLESLADGIGDLQELFGDAEVSRAVLPKQGRLWSTSNGILFVPNDSRVIVFAADQSKLNGDRIPSKRFLNRLWPRLNRNAFEDRFACERRSEELTSDRIALAELLRNDPGVLFWSRVAIAAWRRQRAQWEFVRSNSQVWPERISMRDRDGDRALQTWLEATECPLPANVR